MVAQNFIKALNTRLAATPSIGAKVGYGLIIVCAASISAVVILIGIALSAVSTVLNGTFNNLLAAKSDVEEVESEIVPEPTFFSDGYDEQGPEGPGYYVDGELVG